METHEAINSLRSKECPACGSSKGSGKSLCRSCYFALPAEKRSALYQLVGEGYEEAINAALSHLGPDQPEAS